MPTLTKSNTRHSFPLFWCNIWQKSDQAHVARWLGRPIKNLVIMREGAADTVSAWYDWDEWEDIDKAVVERAQKGDDWFPRLVHEHERRWQALLPYLNQEIQLSDLDDFRQYVWKWIAFWGPMDLVTEIPKMEGVPASARGRALALRKSTERRAYDSDLVIHDFVNRWYRSYDALWPLMTLGEIFRLRDCELSEAEMRMIKERERGWALINGELVTIDALGEKLLEHDITLKQEVVAENTREVRGTPASLGKVVGTVRLVLELEKIDLVEAGDILVTEMTTPEFVPAMKKSAAIVTDEGGVTCHAAIVSRELGKPCVIGTKIATKVLKDGMKVEVDANKGIVKVLE